MCPTGQEMNQVVEMLDKRFKTKTMRSPDVDFSHPGVKVITMHAAKDLEFPVVAVVDSEVGRLPRHFWQGTEEEEHMARK